ncbi:eukaryotic mitochondrial regulator protein-domain-containing protein [Aspergillus californicus]
MPPRIQTRGVPNPLVPYLSSSPLSYSTRLSPSSYAYHLRPSLSLLNYNTPYPLRSFSSTPTVQTKTKRRRQMFEWLETEGSQLKEHIPGKTNYIINARERVKEEEDSDTLRSLRIFPMNSNYESAAILGEDLRYKIHDEVMNKKRSLKKVSVDFGVDMRRVAAVCRLVELEERWKKENKPLAKPYARAIHEMIPTTPLIYDRDLRKDRPHESINDLPAHRLTDAQIFYPVSESRQFSRIDAGRVFSAAPARQHETVADEVANPDDTTSRILESPSRIETVGKGADEQPVLQPADVRIPHSHLIRYERTKPKTDDLTPGIASDKVYRHAKNHRLMLEKEEAIEEKRKNLAKERRESKISRIQPESSRFEFRINDVTVSKETTGADGRGARAPGRRYGVPSYERKKGQAKIPTRVEV